MRVLMYSVIAALISGVGVLVYMWHLEEQTNRILLYNVKQELQAYQYSLSQQHSGQRVAEDGHANTWSRVNAAVRDSVVQIFVQRTQFNWLEPYKTPQQGGSSGTGFFISTDGDIMTNAHVVDQAKAIYIQIPSLGKRQFAAYIVGVCPERDLAKLRLFDNERSRVERLSGAIQYVTLGDSDQLQRSDDVMVLGYPLGQQFIKSTTGVVSGREHLDGRHMIQISAAINPGNSGGPSFTRDGYVVGVNSSKIASSGVDNVGYIIPANEVKLVLRQIEQSHTQGNIAFLRRPFLGVVYNNANETLAEFLGNPQPGAPYITDVFTGSPLHKAGVKPGDMLYEINGHELDPYGEMYVPWSEDKVSVSDYVSRLMPGDPVYVAVYRNGKRIESTTTFTETERPPVRFRYPAYEEIPYELIGGLVVMPLSLNHMPHFASHIPELAKFMDLKHQLKPRVIITHILPDSQAYHTRALKPGDLVKEVNGQEVGSVQEFRDAMYESLHTGYITLKIHETDTFVALPLTDVLSDEDRLARIYMYPVTSLVRDMQHQYTQAQKQN